MAEADNQEMAQAAKKYWSAEGYTEGGVIREVDYATQSGGLDPSLEGIKIVDTDTHITEAPDLFTSRAPARYKDKVPYVRLDADGVERWYVGDRNFGSMGGNVIRRDLGSELMRQVSKHLHQSIVYSMENREDALAYAMQFARDMKPEVADRFVAMWVNDLTLDYGTRGREAVRRLLHEGHKAGIIPHQVQVDFVD